MSGFLNGVKRWILWDFKRGSLQYDVMVALILAFIFLTPRSFFWEQPNESRVVMMPGSGDAVVFWIEADAVGEAAREDFSSRVAELIHEADTGRKYDVDRVEAVSNSDDVVKGYLAYAAKID